MDESIKREILEPIMTAIATSSEETNALVERCITDQIGIRTDLAALKAEVDALKARGSAWDAADAGHSRALADGLAEAKRIATETKEDAARALEGVAARHNELASAIGGCASSIEAIKKDIGGQVLEALGAHVAKIEEAAAELARSPRVKTAASIGGAFAGSALVTGIIELLKHL